MRQQHIADKCRQTAQIGRDHFDDVIHLSRQGICRQNFRQTCDKACEPLGVVTIVRRQGHRDKVDDAYPELLTVKIGAVPADIAFPLKPGALSENIARPKD